MVKPRKKMGRPRKTVLVDSAEIYRKMQKNPIFYIKTMWKLSPQPIKDRYKKRVNYYLQEKEWNKIKGRYFEPFSKGEHITWQQWLILETVRRGKRISVASGHGIGKSAVLAWLVLWFLFCFKNAQVPCTAPTGDQMYDVLWKEINKWMNLLPDAVRMKYEWLSNYVRIKDYPESEKIWWARAKTARKESPEALAGIHGDYVMLIIDEASGVAEEIYTVGEGALTGENVLVIMTSNPTRTIGYFFESHHADKDNWEILSFSSIDSPIVEDGYVKRIAQKYGIESDEYKIRVLGEFPDIEAMDEKGYVPLLLDTQIVRTRDIQFSGEMVMGIDPAGEGKDMTAWIIRDNFVAKLVAFEQKSTPKSIAAKTLTLMDYYGVEGKNIYVDNFGEGANVGQEIALAGHKVNAINVGDNADDKDVYVNKRAECYFRIKEWLVKGGTVEDDILKKELSWMKYRRNPRGKKQIMPKVDMKKDMKKSPDRADALSLTFYNDYIGRPKQSFQTLNKTYV